MAPSTPALLLPTGTIAYTGLDRANALMNFFFPDNPVSSAAQTQLRLIPFQYRAANTRLNTPFTRSELDWAISSGKNTAPGPDGIRYPLLHNLPTDARDTLLSIYNHSLSSGQHPDGWKIARVVPLRKAGKPANEPTGYRPIALTSCVGKVMEKMVLRRLDWQFASLGLHCDRQFGFQAGRSTAEPLLALVTEAHRCLQGREYLVVIFLDIRKAFDLVWHEAILAKLRLLGIHGNLYEWIKSFLQDRHYELTIDGASTTAHPTVGVPQGSCLSPRLFSIVIDGLCSVLPPAVVAALFADDSTLWRSSPSLVAALGDCQLALDAASAYGDGWGLEISKEKTDYMIITKRKIPSRTPHLTLKGQPLNRIQQKKVLGLVLDQRLSWKNHVDHLRVRCAPALALMSALSGTYWGANRDSLFMIYNALVRSRLDYVAPVFSSLALTHQLRLETVQNRALKRITKMPPNTATAALQIELNVPPLVIRRQLLSVRLFLRIKSRFPKFFSSLRPHLPLVWLPNDQLREWFGGACELVERTHLYSLRPPWAPNSPTISFNDDWLASSKAAYSDSHLLSLALPHTATDGYAITVYCDGSKNTEGSACGIGIHSPEANINYSQRVPHMLSITSVELFAIAQAFKLVSTGGTLHVITDSKGALSILKRQGGGSGTARDILENASRKFQAVRFTWVPSHCGVPGNEKADHLATIAISKPYILSSAVPPRELARAIWPILHEHWESHWASGTTGRLLHLIKPHPGPWGHTLALTSEEHTALTALRCDRARLPAYLFQIDASPSPFCTACGALGSVAHLLLNCNMHDTHRAQLEETIAKQGLPFTLRTLLGGAKAESKTLNTVVSATLTFLRHTIGLRALR